MYFFGYLGGVIMLIYDVIYDLGLDYFFCCNE